MPSFTAPTYKQPIQHRLGEYGISFPVGLVVWIRDDDDEVIQTSQIVDPTDINAAKVGSGDFGKAIFRRGKTYEVTSEEADLLTGAGYDVA